MRVEKVNDRYLLCGVILPDSWIKEGQKWAPADGGNYENTVLSVKNGWVTYAGDLQPEHTKDCFSFQCRYCLVIDKDEFEDIKKRLDKE